VEAFTSAGFQVPRRRSDDRLPGLLSPLISKGKSNKGGGKGRKAPPRGKFESENMAYHK